MRAELRPLVAIAAGCLLLGGCASVRELAERGRAADATDAEMLAAVSLTEGDASADAVFSPLEGGTEVEGRTSLDLCFGQFPSEADRVGRQQVGISDPEQTIWVSSEAILYGTPEQARKAMSELDEARQQCPDEPVPAPGDEASELTWTFTDPPDAGWPQEPGVDRQAYAFTVRDADGQERVGTATYLQRGRMVLALYAAPPDGPASAVRNAPSPARFTEVMANRLGELPGAALQRTTAPRSTDGPQV